jgi:hypothetical protein
MRWLHQPPAMQPSAPMTMIAKARPDCADDPGATSS